MQKKVEIPDEIEIEIQENKVTVKENGEELEEEFKLGRVDLEKKDGKIQIEAENPKRKEKAMIGTIKGKIENMINGLQDEYQYKLRTIYKHFPMNLSVKGDKVEIQNFAGEQEPRYSRIMGDTEVELKGEEIIVKGKDKEKAGQTAANLEQVTWIKEKDPRIFEDGIYIVEKPGD